MVGVDIESRIQHTVHNGGREQLKRKREVQKESAVIVQNLVDIS